MTARAGQVAWVIHYEDDLEADFARFFRCDMYDLPAPRFFARAARVSAYGGVMAVRLAELDAPEEPLPDGARQVPLSDLSDLIEIG